MGKRGVAYCSLDLLGNNAQFVSVDLIGEKNQVILELKICLSAPIIAVLWLVCNSR